MAANVIFEFEFVSDFDEFSFVISWCILLEILRLWSINLYSDYTKKSGRLFYKNPLFE